MDTNDQVSKDAERGSFKMFVVIILAGLGSIFLIIGGFIHLETVLTNGKPLFYLSFDKAMRGISFLRGFEPEIKTGANMYEVILVFLVGFVGVGLTYYNWVQYKQARERMGKYESENV